jgi:hypothetical protein
VLKKLTDEIERVEFKHKIDVLALQEIRWNGYIGEGQACYALQQSSKEA